MAVVSIQFQQRIPFVDADGRLSNDGVRALNSLAQQISDIATLYDLTGALGADLSAIAGAPVVTTSATPAFTAERVLSALTPLQLFYAPSSVQLRFTGCTDDVPEGVVNLYFTQARARGSLSNGTGISYNSGTGAIALDLTYTDGRYLQSGSSSSLNIRTITATATPAATDYTILCDAAGGAIVINLPAAAGQAKRVLTVKKIDASANIVTIDPDSAELIDGSATLGLSAQWQSATIQCNGAGWFVL